MQKKLLAAMLALVGTGASLAVSAAQTGQITITGKVIDTTCVVDAGSGNVQVTLPNVDKSLLQNPGSYTGITPFSVKVSGCTGSSGTGADTVSMAFVPDSNVDMNGNLANTGSATAVAVQLLDKNQQPINVHNDSYSAQVARGESTDVAGGDVNLNYYARYFSAAGGATAGTVVSQANFQLIYQ
ncbi:hypothetical protein DK254_28335 [Pseudomonas sp. RW407]|uniref:fimbrial protein n=1 Tax=Pseudomonas sp. RW407 TaxID=2202894 RepID=UPI000D700DFB|nr:fimbrial protein [Pseudomonas sp. RW407]PWU26475.1 hypothetical protein DK254_28335 [Pseudomonas sp. RW407]